MDYIEYTALTTASSLQEGQWLHTSDLISSGGHFPIGGWQVGFRPVRMKITLTSTDVIPALRIRLIDGANQQIAGDSDYQEYLAGTHDYIFNITFAANDIANVLFETPSGGVEFTVRFFLAETTVPNTNPEDNAMEIEGIPASLRVPGTYITIDGSMAGLNSGTQPNLLLVGFKKLSGSAISSKITLAASLADVEDKCGKDSMLWAMAKRFFTINPLLNLYLLPFTHNTNGDPATATIEVTDAATAAGTLALYVSGQLISVAINADMTTDEVASAISAAVNNSDDFYNTVNARATVSASIVTLTARHNGPYGNQIDLRVNANPADKTPAGLILEIAGFSGGSLMPITISEENIAAIFDADESGYLYAPSKYIALGLNDDVTMQAFHAESQRRYASPIQSGFRIFTAFSASYGDQIDYGQAKNGEHISCLGLNDGGTAPFEAAAIYATVASAALYDNPVKSLEGKVLKGLKVFDTFTFAQENSLLYAGISTCKKSRDGTVTISRAISMYQHRNDDSPDDAYLDINTAEAMERIRFLQRMGAIQRFQGKVAAGTNDTYRAGLPIVNVDTIRAYLLSLYKNTIVAELGWARDYEWYKDQLIIEQDADNPSRFNYIDAPVLNSPFYILAGKAQFRKLPE